MYTGTRTGILYTTDIRNSASSLQVGLYLSPTVTYRYCTSIYNLSLSLWLDKLGGHAVDETGEDPIPMKKGQPIPVLYKVYTCTKTMW